MNNVLIIAEAGVNHNGSKSLAFELIAAAKEAGADAVKFQTFNADKLVHHSAPKAQYQIANTGEKESQHAMLKRLELTAQDHHDLAAFCDKKDIQFLSTPFDLESLHFLVYELNMQMIKIASGEITNVPLLLAAAQTQLPILLSTGMTTLGDIEHALSVLAFGYLKPAADKIMPNEFLLAYRSAEGRKALRHCVSLLHCVSNYPANYDEVNLSAIETLRNAFRLPVGYSDHTLGISIPIAATAVGALIIEKHFTLDKSLPGPDHAASLTPDELKDMVKSIRETELALGDGHKVPSLSELNNRGLVRKSLVTIKKIAQGETFTAENLGLKRPGLGICATHYWEWIGKVANRDYEENEWITD